MLRRIPFTMRVPVMVTDFMIGWLQGNAQDAHPLDRRFGVFFGFLAIASS